jgi:hypothetical protein
MIKFCTISALISVENANFFAKEIGENIC